MPEMAAMPMTEYQGRVSTSLIENAKNNDMNGEFRSAALEASDKHFSHREMLIKDAKATYQYLMAKGDYHTAANILDESRRLVQDAVLDW